MNSGIILDSDTKEVRLGRYEIENTMEVSHSSFQTGDIIQVWLDVKNTGSLSLNGLGKIEIFHIPSSQIISKLEEEITLEPQEDKQLTYSWDTSGADRGSYRILGYVLYGCQTSNLCSETISTYEDINIVITTGKDFYDHLEKVGVSVTVKDSEGNSMGALEGISGRLLRPDSTTNPLELLYDSDMDMYSAWFYVAPAYPDGIYEIEAVVQEAGYSKTTKKKSIFIGDYSSGDCDGDGTDNVNDPDDDNDGLPDSFEEEKTGTSIFIEDSDYNGITDGDEDTDGDRFSNIEEFNGETDPQNADEYPEIEEKCDGIDNDKDGYVDESGAQGCTTYYIDNDGDTYGIEEDKKCLCSGEGYYIAARPGDCNNSRADINPEAPEVLDGIDNDCDGYIDEESITINIELNSGWNMLYLPLIPDNAYLSSLFPDAVVIYGYDKTEGYGCVKEEETLEEGKGYWILLDQNQTYILTGQSTPSFKQLVYEDGWTMIGGCTSGAMISGENCKISVIYSYEQGSGYKRVQEYENLEAGRGYWILLEDVRDQASITVYEATE